MKAVQPAFAVFLHVFLGDESHADSEVVPSVRGNNCAGVVGITREVYYVCKLERDGKLKEFLKTRRLS